MKLKMLMAALFAAGLVASGPAAAQEKLTVWWAKGYYKGEDDAGGDKEECPICMLVSASAAFSDY